MFALWFLGLCVVKFPLYCRWPCLLIQLWTVGQTLLMLCNRTILLHLIWVLPLICSCKSVYQHFQKLLWPATRERETHTSSDISNSPQTGRVLHQYANQLQVSAWQCALLQTEGALWWRAVSRHQNVWQCAVGPEKKSPELHIISWVDNSMEKLRATGKTRRDPSQTWPLFSFHCQ